MSAAQKERSFADVSDVPDGTGSVVGDEQATVFGDGDTYGTAPDLAVFGDEAGKEVFIAAVGVAVVHGDVNDFVAGAVSTVPGAVFGGKGVAVILFGKFAGGWVESHLKRSHVRLNENVGSNHLRGEIDALAGLGLVRGERARLRVGASAIGAGLRKARILVAAHVVPGPAVETTFLDRGDIVGDQVIAEIVALVGGAPQLAGGGVNGFAHTIADAGGVHLDELAFGRELEYVGAVELLRVGVRVVHV